MPDPSLWGHFIIQLVLIAVIAFFSYAESAIMSSSIAHLDIEAEEGNKKAQKILKLIERPKTLLATRFIVTLFGFFGAAFIAGNGHIVQKITDSVMKKYGINAGLHTPVHSVVLAVVIILLACLYFLLGILIPSRLGASKPEKKAKSVCGFVGFVVAVLTPIIAVLTAISNVILRLFGIDPNAKEDEVTEEEIRQMVDVGEESGNIETNEKEMIENIFEFNNTTAADIMIHRTEMTAIDVSDSSDEILAIIDETGYSRFPVFEENIDNIIGILSTRVFLMNRCAKNPKKLRDILYEPNFVPETVRADALFRDMQAKKSHMAVVLDEYGGTSGLVTMEDLLEEIVGNIYDETDEPSEESEICKIDDTHYRINGTAELEKVEEALGIDFSSEDDELSTLSGLIFSRFTTIPADGETPELDIGNLHVKVEQITEHRVVTALAEVMPVADTDIENKSDTTED